MLCLNLSDIAIITAKCVDLCWVIHDLSISDGIHLLENSVGIYKMHVKDINIKKIVYNYYFDDLITA